MASRKDGIAENNVYVGVREKELVVCMIMGRPLGIALRRLLGVYECMELSVAGQL